MVDIDINSILESLPHRYPFLLVDRVLDCEPGKSLTAIKNVTFNEPFFQGHFPIKPVMPAVLILEAMAQASIILGLQTVAPERNDDAIFYFVGIDKARFRRPVVPGDQLKIHVEYGRRVRGIIKVVAEAKVDGELVASAELMATLKDIDS